MGAAYHRAESESGDHIEGPSEDALFILIDDLNGSDNTSSSSSQTRTTRSGSPPWRSWTKVATRSSDATPPVANTTVTETSIDRIARDLTIWVAAPRPSRTGHQHTSNF
jgi:hypothetical protein